MGQNRGNVDAQMLLARSIGERTVCTRRNVCTGYGCQISKSGKGNEHLNACLSRMGTDRAVETIVNGTVGESLLLPSAIASLGFQVPTPSSLACCWVCYQCLLFLAKSQVPASTQPNVRTLLPCPQCLELAFPSWSAYMIQ